MMKNIKAEIIYNYLKNNSDSENTCTCTINEMVKGGGITNKSKDYIINCINTLKDMNLIDYEPILYMKKQPEKLQIT